MHAAIRFSQSRSESASSSLQAASTAAEPIPTVSSIARGHEDDRGNAKSALEPSVQQPASTSSRASAFSQRSFRSDSLPSAAVAGAIPVPLTASLSYSDDENGAEAVAHHCTENPPARVPSSLPGSITTCSSEACKGGTRAGSGSSRESHSHPAAPRSSTAAQLPHSSSEYYFPNLPWIPPPPIYGTPLPDSSNMNRYYAHYYDPTAAALRAPFCYPEEVPRRAPVHHRAVSDVGWPTPSDVPLPSTFPMPPHVLPRPSLPIASPSAVEAAAGDAVTPPYGWAVPPPLLYPPPPPPWWFYAPPPPPLSASMSCSSAGRTRSSSDSSSASHASARSATGPSHHLPSNVARRVTAHLHAEAAASSRRRVAVPAGSVVTPVAVASRRGVCGSQADNRRSVASSVSPFAATRTGDTVRVARTATGPFSAASNTAATTAGASTVSYSAPPQRVERRVYASNSSESSGTQRAASRMRVPVPPRRTSAARRIHPLPPHVHEQESMHERGSGSSTARMQAAVSTAEEYLNKMESLYHQLRKRYEEFITLSEALSKRRADAARGEAIEGKRHPLISAAATTRAARSPQETGPRRPPPQAVSLKARPPSTAPAPHARRAASSAMPTACHLSVEPSPPLSLSSSETSAASLRHELQLLESQWQRLEELKRHGGIGATTTAAPSGAPSTGAAVSTVKSDHLTRRRFLRLIQNRKQLLMSAS
ncbi:hypothetical protein LSCM1_04748 [Leishmania martiniquensis]|uniref:Uncharacterized protein n=1 Tax=Leishmania martiniquensis TaxID=1580590 RepID=A0A836GUS5_9TRYP|nr:hypothetical protein LSCM1_04748 [Leishmania martiniquensis]